MMNDILSEEQLACGGILVMLVGPPGSGKSTYAKNLESTDDNWLIVSPDVIRKKITGDESDQSRNDAVFGQVYNELVSRLDAGFNVIYDATNCRNTYRRKILNVVNGHASNVICVVFTTSIAECLNRNNQRDRIVPENVIERMYFTLKKHPPTIFEGYDIILKA